MVNSENSHTCNKHVITINERGGKGLEKEQRWIYRRFWKEENEERNVIITIYKI